MNHKPNSSGRAVHRSNRVKHTRHPKKLNPKFAGTHLVKLPELLGAVAGQCRGTDAADYVQKKCVCVIVAELFGIPKNKQNHFR